MFKPIGFVHYNSICLTTCLLGSVVHISVYTGSKADQSIWIKYRYIELEDLGQQEN